MSCMYACKSRNSATVSPCYLLLIFIQTVLTLKVHEWCYLTKKIIEKCELIILRVYTNNISLLLYTNNRSSIRKSNINSLFDNNWKIGWGFNQIQIGKHVVDLQKTVFEQQNCTTCHGFQYILLFEISFCNLKACFWFEVETFGSFKARKSS